MRILRHPVLQFLVIGLLTAAAIAVGTSMLAGQTAEDEALAEAKRTTQFLADGAQEKLPVDLQSGNTKNTDRYFGRIKSLLDYPEVHRIVVWTDEGRLRVYRGIDEDQDAYLEQFQGDDAAAEAASQRRDDQLAEAGVRDPAGRDPGRGQLTSQLRIGSAEREVLATEDERLVRVEQADPDTLVNREIRIRYGDRSDGLLRTYTRITDDPGNVYLLEVYYSSGPIAARSQELFSAFRWIGIGGLAILVVAVTPMLLVLTRRLTRAARERERLLQSALDASDRERRRIARDLHDGVVQDIAGTAFTVSAVARDRSLPPNAEGTLTGAASSLRDSLRGLRSLLAEIHPPDLEAVGLPAALDDLTAPAAAAGVQASVRVDGVEETCARTTAVVWRVAQEAVRNTLRHADASTLAITVRGEGERVHLDVVDDGVGFDPADRRDRSHFGLHGIRSLVAECDGRLDVRSAPGEGTRVSMEVSAR